MKQRDANRDEEVRKVGAQLESREARKQAEEAQRKARLDKKKKELTNLAMRGGVLTKTQSNFNNQNFRNVISKLTVNNLEVMVNRESDVNAEPFVDQVKNDIKEKIAAKKPTKILITNSNSNSNSEANGSPLSTRKNELLKKVVQQIPGLFGKYRREWENEIRKATKMTQLNEINKKLENKMKFREKVSKVKLTKNRARQYKPIMKWNDNLAKRENQLEKDEKNQKEENQKKKENRKKPQNTLSEPNAKKEFNKQMALRKNSEPAKPPPAKPPPAKPPPRKSRRLAGLDPVNNANDYQNAIPNAFPIVQSNASEPPPAPANKTKKAWKKVGTTTKAVVRLKKAGANRAARKAKAKGAWKKAGTKTKAVLRLKKAGANRAAKAKKNAPAFVPNARQRVRAKSAPPGGAVAAPGPRRGGRKRTKPQLYGYNNNTPRGRPSTKNTPISTRKRAASAPKNFKPAGAKKKGGTKKRLTAAEAAAKKEVQKRDRAARVEEAKRKKRLEEAKKARVAAAQRPATRSTTQQQRTQGRPATRSTTGRGKKKT